MVTVAYNAYCVISKEGDDDTYGGKTVGSRSWEVGATVNTEFSCGDPIVLYWNPWYTEPCYKGSLLYKEIQWYQLIVA